MSLASSIAALSLGWWLVLRASEKLTFLSPPSLPSQRRSLPAQAGIAAAPASQQGVFVDASPLSQSSSWLAAALGFTFVGSAMLRHGQRHTSAAAYKRRGPRRVAAAAQANTSPHAVTSEGPPYVEPAPVNLREVRIEVSSNLNQGPWTTPRNDRLLRAARGEKVDRPPKWIMRQAGRYLPEYRAVLKHSDFFTVCKTPELACEITLQPYRRYPTLDSLIIFSDILVIPVAMGMGCRMEPQGGPQFDFAIESPQDIERLNLKPDIQKSLGYVFDAIYLTRQRVNNEVPVIGFSGAPWTLMGYMVQGGSSSNLDRAKKWLYQHPEESRHLLQALRDIVVEYLVGQYDSGAPMLMVFDTNCGQIPPHLYEEFCVQDLKYIAEEVKRQRPGALMAVFPKDGELSAFEDSAYDVVCVSWTTSASQARAWCPSKTLQGNLDPYIFYADPEHIREKVKGMVTEFGVDKYIANLGHGMMPTHPVEGPQAFMDAIDALPHTKD